LSAFVGGLVPVTSVYDTLSFVAKSPASEILAIPVDPDLKVIAPTIVPLSISICNPDVG
jgi:hypothetical protein